MYIFFSNNIQFLSFFFHKVLNRCHTYTLCFTIILHANFWYTWAHTLASRLFLLRCAVRPSSLGYSCPLKRGLSLNTQAKSKKAQQHFFFIHSMPFVSRKISDLFPARVFRQNVVSVRWVLDAVWPRHVFLINNDAPTKDFCHMHILWLQLKSFFAQLDYWLWHYLQKWAG